MNAKSNPSEELVEILIVEDSPTQAEQLRHLLEQHSYRVTVANDGKQALALLGEHPPALVITDIVMPEMDGYELCQRIKADERIQNIPVILLTSLSNSEDVLEGLAAGADSFITKPYSEEYLLTNLRQILTNRQLRKGERVRIGVEIRFAGKTRFITADQQQMLTLLISTYEAAVHRNAELIQTQNELKALNERLEDMVEERTAALRVEITERKRAEESLQKERKRLYDVLETLPVMICLLTPDYHVTFANRTFRERFGESHGRHCYDYIFGRTEPCEFCEAYTVLKTGKPHHWEATYPDGHSIIDVYDFPFTDVDGSHLILEMNIDITERKRAEADNRRLATAINHAVEAVMVTDPEGTIQYVNPAFERITGYTREEVVGKNPRILKSGKQDEGFYRDLWNTIKRGEVWSGRLVNMKKDGTLYEEEETISPVFDSEGRIANYVAVRRDITMQSVLEQRVRQAQKLEAIGTLAGGIAHDFNNVLAAILGYTQMAKEAAPSDSPVRADLDRVLSAAYRATDLVRQILTFSHKTAAERSPIKLQFVIKEALKFLRPSLPATIEIREDLDAGCPPVLADATQMHQVVMNLCTNAYHAMRERGGILGISLKPFDVGSDSAQSHPGLHEGSHVRITVSDTGHGMDKETVARIFEPFFTTKPPGEGTGLGLATVHGILAAHGAAITVYSEPSKGTTFCVYIPAIEEGLTAESVSEEAPIPGGNERILVVDDEEPLASLTGRALRRFGYEVVTFTNSADAAAAFRAHPEFFDLVVTDQTMPRMTGEDLAQAVMSIRPGVPVILMTGFSDVMSREKAEQVGVRAFLLKPASTLQIAKLVREVLDQARAQAASR
jgi:PAS domain S-box-containing protein